MENQNTVEPVGGGDGDVTRPLGLRRRGRGVGERERGEHA